MAGEPGADNHILSKLPTNEVDDEILIRGHGVHARLPDDRPTGGVDVAGHELVDPPRHRVRQGVAASAPVPPIRVARRTAVRAHLDQAWELHGRRGVDAGVTVAGECREAGLRRELMLAAGAGLPVADERVQRLHWQVDAGDRLDKLARPRAHCDDALGAVELLPARRLHQDRSISYLAMSITSVLSLSTAPFLAASDWNMATALVALMTPPSSLLAAVHPSGRRNTADHSHDAAESSEAPTTSAAPPFWMAARRAGSARGPMSRCGVGVSTR
ncbi:hypothetical protein EE612_060076 [Oryza sativa]|nr:hypothetical protein EE612_060076 [Oryza sativa]